MKKEYYTARMVILYLIAKW